MNLLSALFVGRFFYFNEMKSWLKKILSKKPTPLAMDKFLIVGLGNIGESYENTRHNIGFRILDYLAKVQEFDFTLEKHAAVAKTKIKTKK